MFDFLVLFYADKICLASRKTYVVLYDTVKILEIRSAAIFFLLGKHDGYNCFFLITNEYGFWFKHIYRFKRTRRFVDINLITLYPISPNIYL